VAADEKVGDGKEGLPSEERRVERDREVEERLWLRPNILGG
jgi:hypothetical protein